MTTDSTIKKSILIIDDDEVITSLIDTILTKEGYEVHIANNGVDGLKMAMEVKPNLIFMDITMPGQDGYETTESIKSRQELFEIPIVFLSGQSEGEDNGKAFAKGGVSFICKPFANQQLISLTKLILETVHID